VQNTVAVNFAGNPALAVPVPLRHESFPVTSLQLVGPKFSEAELLNAGRLVEAGVEKSKPVGLEELDLQRLIHDSRPACDTGYLSGTHLWRSDIVTGTRRLSAIGEVFQKISFSSR
jgi:hypothetical protein